ncbi:MAG: hypothetical protein ACKVRO_04035 [Micropepsaceae bacterium]
MEHRSPRPFGQSRLSTLLLAGTAVCVTGTARAEPIQGFWLTPTVLASSLGVEASAAAQQIKALKAKVFAKHDVELFVAPAPDWKDLTPAFDNLDTPVQFSDGNAPQAPVSIKFRGAAFDLEPAVNVQVDRLASGMSFATVAAESAGFDAQLFNGRLSFSTDIVKTVDESDARDFRDPQLRERDRAIDFADTSRRHRFSAKVIDSENLKLLVDGDFGETSEGFSTALSELPTGRLVLPGSWANLSSSLEFGEARVKVDYQDFVSSRGAVKRQGLTLAYASSALQVYRKEGMEFNLTQGGQWLKRTSFTGINADVIVADVLPDAVAEAIDPIRPFLPTVLSGGFERGDVIRAELLPGPRDRVSTANAALMWDTRLGETTASFWQRQIKTDIVTPGNSEGSLPLKESRDRFIDVSHKVRRGNWQFGAGLSMIETDDTINGIRETQSEIAPHISVAYAPENGPKIELRYGAADAQSQIIDDNLAARAKTKQLQLSVDVSNFVQEELNRPDAKLKLEYRYDLNGSDRDPVTNRERGGGHAVLLTFSTPLN